MPFEGPTDVRPKGTGALEKLQADDIKGSGVRLPDEALVLVDLIPNRTKPVHLDLFPDDVSLCGRRIWLRLKEPKPLESSSLLAILTDVAEVLHGLQASGARRLHVGLATPDVAAFFLGQALHALPPILLYDHCPQSGSYELAFPLFG